MEKYFTYSQKKIGVGKLTKIKTDKRTNNDDCAIFKMQTKDKAIIKSNSESDICFKIKSEKKDKCNEISNIKRATSIDNHPASKKYKMKSSIKNDSESMILPKNGMYQLDIILKYKEQRERINTNKTPFLLKKEIKMKIDKNGKQNLLKLKILHEMKEMMKKINIKEMSFNENGRFDIFVKLDENPSTTKNSNDPFEQNKFSKTIKSGNYFLKNNKIELILI